MSANKQVAATPRDCFEVFSTFLKLGCTSFGGPVAHLGYFHRELVEHRKWVTEGQYAQLLAVCQFLPGPASSQLGFSLGLVRAGWCGALSAFLGFTLPSALLLVGFTSALNLLSGELGQAALHGLKIVALAVVAAAVLGMSKRLCPDVSRATIGFLSMAMLVVVGMPWVQLFVVAAGGVAGSLLCRCPMEDQGSLLQIGYSKRLGALLGTVFLALLFGLPLFADHSAGAMSLAQPFYRAGALVFGGGHVVLPLLEDSVVSTGLISKETFLAGYGAAQAIPGPMFSFAAYLGAVAPTGQHAWIGAVTALTFLFLPGFLLVAGVLPFWSSIAKHAGIRNAIAGINAAVVGLLAAALYDPIFLAAIQSPIDMGIGLVAFGMLVVWKLSPLATVAWCAAASVLGTLV